MESDRNEILIYKNGEYVKENIPAGKWLRLIYGDSLGAAPLKSLVKRKFLSRVYGAYCRTKHSKRMIDSFIKEHNMDMSTYSGSYNNFAEFFARAKDKEHVNFPADAKVLGSPCEGAISAYVDIDINELVAAKGQYYRLGELLGDNELAKAYQGGTMLHIRLVPSDYHRAHFFDDGVVTGLKMIDGDLFSVSPIAVARVARLYCQNKRARVSYSTENFGEAEFVEVGATFVGSMVHSFEVSDAVKRGQEAAYFLPGGSLLIIFFKKGEIVVNDEILTQTATGYETKIDLGDVIGYSARVEI